MIHEYASGFDARVLLVGGKCVTSRFEELAVVEKALRVPQDIAQQGLRPLARRRSRRGVLPRMQRPARLEPVADADFEVVVGKPSATPHIPL